MMQYAMYCENGHRIDFVDPATGEREADYIGDFTAHLLNADADGNPIPLPKFCADCRAKTMSKCHGCGAYIRYNDSRVHYVPSYCTDCGEPFPWTATALAAANEYTDELDLSTEDKMVLKGSFVDLTVDSPRTELAVSRFKRIYTKIAPTAGPALLNTLLSVATDYVKKKLLGL